MGASRLTNYSLIELDGAEKVSSGAGVAISADLLVTACHAVGNAKTIAVATPNWGDLAAIADLWVNQNGYDRCWLKLQTGSNHCNRYRVCDRRPVLDRVSRSTRSVSAGGAGDLNFAVAIEEFWQ